MPLGQAGSDAKGKGSRLAGTVSDRAAVLAGSVDPQHQDVTGGRAAAGVGADLVEHAVSAGAGKLAYARMLADRPLTRVLPERADVGSDRG